MGLSQLLVGIPDIRTNLMYPVSAVMYSKKGYEINKCLPSQVMRLREQAVKLLLINSFTAIIANKNVKDP